MDRNYIDGKAAAWCIPLALLATLTGGRGSMAAVAAMVATVGLLHNGKVCRMQARAWTALGLFLCVGAWFHGLKGAWADSLLLCGAVVLLYQSFDVPAKQASKTRCLRVAAVLAALSMVDLYMAKAGCPAGAGLFGTPDGTALFFAMAALSDNSLRRRCLFSTVLGMTGSVLGLLSLGVGLLFKKQDWAEDTLWVSAGLLFLACPSPNLWLLFAAFLFWCVPEAHAFLGKGFEKWRFVPLLFSLANPWCLSMLKRWAISVIAMARKWDGQVFFGSGAGSMLHAGGLFQSVVELGIPTAIVLFLCAFLFLKKPSGCAWWVSFLFGAGAFLPSVLVFGAGTGIGDDYEEDMEDGRPYFFLMLAMGLYLST